MLNADFTQDKVRSSEQKKWWTPKIFHKDPTRILKNEKFHILKNSCHIFFPWPKDVLNDMLIMYVHA